MGGQLQFGTGWGNLICKGITQLDIFLIMYMGIILCVKYYEFIYIEIASVATIMSVHV